MFYYYYYYLLFYMHIKIKFSVLTHQESFMYCCPSVSCSQCQWRHCYQNVDWATRLVILDNIGIEMMRNEFSDPYFKIQDPYMYVDSLQLFAIGTAGFFNPCPKNVDLAAGILFLGNPALQILRNEYYLNVSIFKNQKLLPYWV